jgi:hypothetical protein
MAPLEILRLTLLVAHFIGLAAIIGSFIFQLPRRSALDFRAMFIGSIVQLVTGVGLIATRKLTDLPVLDEKMAVKLAIALIVLVAVIIGQRRKSRPFFLTAGIAAIANVVVATVWS